MLLQSPAEWWQLLVLLGVALVLSTAIGVERQLKQKSAGMRTHTLVGLGAALFMVISKYGFTDVAQEDLVTLDPSRVAAQIVSGIGFIGAGLVFVRYNKVRGLTTAASIWLTAAVGSAAGAGLVVPAAFVTACHFLISYLYPVIVRKTRMGRSQQSTLRVRYVDGTGALRSILQTCTEYGVAVHGFATRGARSEHGGLLGRLAEGLDPATLPKTQVEVELDIEGGGPLPDLVARLSELTDVVSVHLEDSAES